MRAQPRIEFQTDVQLDIGENSLPGRTTDISRGGAFVAVEPAPPVGTRLELQIRLPGVPDICRIPCIVRWTSIDRGVGVQFQRLRPIEVWALNRLARSTALSA